MEEAYPDAQIDALVVLLHALQEELPSLRHIAGHDDLDTAMVPASDDPQILVPRKRDPGPMFPWQRVLAEVSLQHVGRGYGGTGAGTERRRGGEGVGSEGRSR